MRPLFSLASLVAFVSTPAFIFAQTNLIQNPGFERSTSTANIWTGIGLSGTINAPTERARVLDTTGKIGDQPMPISVSAGDLNSDGLNDIAIMDGLGLLRVHFNIGTNQQPKFAPAEFASLYLNPKFLRLSHEENKLLEEENKKKTAPKKIAKQTTTAGINIEGLEGVELVSRIYDARRVQRVNLADVSRSGKLDLLVGNYNGDVLLIPNSGTPSRPDFRTPDAYESALLQKGPERWGNVFAPYGVDWDKDDKMDLLIGEASYSANSIHIFPGKGIGRPSVQPEDRSVLAYGMGLEQLSSCVVDYNGDGNNDLLIADRGGRVAVYLGKGGPFKPGSPISFHSFITINGAAPALPPNTPTPEPGSSLRPMDAIKATNLLNLDGGSTIAAADYNGDGLFDLVFGKRSGGVAMAINQGTATEPKFKAPEDVKVEGDKKNLFLPPEWEVDFGDSRGNFGGYMTVVKSDPANSSNSSNSPAATPAEGSSFLEAGYFKLDYKIMPQPVLPDPAEEEGLFLIKSPNVFTFTQKLTTPFKVNKTYVLSFKVKGAQINNARATIVYTGFLKLGSGAVVSSGSRGGVAKDLSDINEDHAESVTYTGGSNWVEVKKEFTVKLDAKELEGVRETKKGLVRFIFELTPGSGIVQFDDIKLTEK